MKILSFSCASSRATALVALALLAATPAHALNIQATYAGAYFSSHPAAQAAIQSAVDFFNASYSDPTTVRITFQNDSSVLGESSTFITQPSYSAYLAALTAHSSGSANDVAALAQLAAHPFVANQITLATSLARNLGLTTYAGTDSTISLGIDSMFLDHSSPVAGKYDLRSVVEHEMDEALGSFGGGGSSIPAAADQFAYEAVNVRNDDTDTSKHVYFSLDGTHDIVEFNHYHRPGGDWLDYAEGGPLHVQNAFGTPGVTIDYSSVEFAMQDAIGWNVANAVPEPAPLLAFGLGGLALLRRKRKV